MLSGAAMADQTREAASTSTLSTKLEEDFIAPLTAIRGALEILRDFGDLDAAERRRFVETALSECARIEQGVRELGVSVYGAAREAPQPADDRVALLPDGDIAELDFAGLDFDSAEAVDEVFDRIERRIAETGQRWWFLVNYTDCHVFPEAWIAFAHRGKKVRVEWGYGTIRYAEDGAGGLPDRAGALAQIDAARAAMR